MAVTINSLQKQLNKYPNTKIILISNSITNIKLINWLIIDCHEWSTILINILVLQLIVFIFMNKCILTKNHKYNN